MIGACIKRLQAASKLPCAARPQPTMRYLLQPIQWRVQADFWLLQQVVLAYGAESNRRLHIEGEARPDARVLC